MVKRVVLAVIRAVRRLQNKLASLNLTLNKAIMTIAYACVLFMGLLPYVAAGIAKKGFEGYDNGMPRQWLAKQTGFRARANAAQANLFESLPLFFAAVIIASVAHAPQDRIDLLAMGFVLARIAYLVCYVADWPTTRSIVWLFGIICAVALFFQI
jgi:uncharacterized MAPEG superfamily protein